METNVFAAAMQNVVGSHLPAILGAVGILIAGYILALAARAATRKLLSLLRLNQLFSGPTGKSVDLEGAAGIVVYAVILLATLLAMFNVLDLDQVSGPFALMLGQITTYLPHLLAGGVLIVVAWLAATAVRALADRALAATQWDEKLVEQAGMSPLGKNVGLLLFWLVILLFLPAILSALQLGGTLEPVRNMLDKILYRLPDVFAAGVIVAAGWLVARVLQSLVSHLLAAVGSDRLGERAGLREGLKLSRLAGLLVFILVLVPSAIAALDALGMTAVSQPASAMLAMLLEAVPNLIAAALILFLTWVVARFTAELLGSLLANLGADTLPAKLGLAHLGGDKPTLSLWIPRLMVFFAMLFATVEAANRLGFDQVESLVSLFIVFGGDILLGFVILLVGYWLSTIVHAAMLRASGNATAFAGIARYAVLGLVVAMGLSAMGIADSIVNLAFALVLGSIAVAVALAFGLGGREAAGRQMEYWLAKLRKED